MCVVIVLANWDGLGKLASRDLYENKRLNVGLHRGEGESKGEKT